MGYVPVLVKFIYGRNTPIFPLLYSLELRLIAFSFPDDFRLCLYWLIRCCCDKISRQKAWKEGLIFGLRFEEAGIDRGGEGMAAVRKAWWHHEKAG